MSAEYPRSLPFWQKVTLAYAVCKALNSGLWAFILSPFRGKSGASSALVHAKLALGRKLLESVTITQNQFLAAPVDSIYPAYAQKRAFVPEIVTLKDGTKAYWLGNPKSENVLIWYHGNGFALAADPGHLVFVQALIDYAKKGGKDLGVLFPAYTLAPYARYPRQIQQGVETLRYVLDDLNVKPGKVMIGGDSAGGNLSLGVISHILHPHPKIPPLSLAAPLKGAILLCPWASFDTSWPSMESNKYKDVVTTTIGNRWSANYLGTSIKDEYNEALRADPKWWTDLQNTVDEIFVVAAKDEILIDSIQEMGKKLQAAHSKTTIVIAPNEFHDQCTSSALGTPGEGQQADAIKSWIASRL